MTSDSARSEQIINFRYIIVVMSTLTKFAQQKMGRLRKKSLAESQLYGLGNGKGFLQDTEKNGP